MDACLTPDVSRWDTVQLATFLMQAEREGVATYSRPLGSFLHSDCERDLFAHVALVLARRPFEALPETSPDGYSNIDLLMDGQLWEVKSPNGDSLRGVETAVRKAQRHFRKCTRPEQPARLIFNARYHSLDDSALLPELRRRLEQHGLSDSLFVTKKGRVLPVANEKTRRSS